MTTYEISQIIIQVASAVLVFGGLIYASLQLKLLRKTHVDEHEWNRRKAAQDATQLFRQRVGTTEIWRRRFTTSTDKIRCRCKNFMMRLARIRNLKHLFIGC